MARLAAALVSVALGGVLASPLAAQTVRGTLTEAGTRAPVSGALVLLVDDSKVQRAGGLTDDAGRFQITAPRSGRYTLRAERIGYATTLSPAFELGGGETRDVLLTAAAGAVALEGIQVQARGRRCAVRPQVGAATATLWEEARKALNATAWAQSQNLFTFQLAKYEHDLDAGSLQVTREVTPRSTSRAARPFHSVPIKQLEGRGFVQQTDSGTYYYAPDAQVLFSDWFLDNHCFRVAEPQASGDSLIGLAFDPVRGQRVPDIAGTLWVDKKSAELRFLEYTYTNLGLGVPTDRLGGRIDFERLPTGAWIVRNWWIRSPMITVETVTQQSVSGAPGERRQRQVLSGLREHGGVVTGISTRGGRPVAAVVQLALSGIVFDSTQQAPLAGARVYLSGTQYSAIADANGKFVIEGVPEGEYQASFLHPGADAIGYLPQPVAVSLRRGAAFVNLGIPSSSRLASLLCGGAERQPGTGVLAGAVRDASTGSPVPGATVVATWGRTRVRAQADESGIYRLCGVPAGAAVTAQAEAGSLRSGQVELQLVANGLARQDLQVGQGTGVLAANDRGAPVASAQRSDGAARRDPNVIWAAEFERAAATNLFDAVQSLRPQWLRGRGAKTLQTVTVAVGGESMEMPKETPIIVYQENVRLGELYVLRDMHAGDVASVRFLDAQTATLRWGTGHAAGAILVTLKGGK